MTVRCRGSGLGEDDGLGAGSSSPSAEPGRDAGVSRLGGEGLRIEVVAEHLEPFVASGVRGIAQDGEQLLVTQAAAAILRRAVPPSGDAGGVSPTLDRRAPAPPPQPKVPLIPPELG